MNFSYSFPALVNAQPPKCGSPRPMFVELDGTVDIPEISPDEAPVACSGQVDTLAFEFRWYDGGFYFAGENTPSRPGRLPGEVSALFRSQMLGEIAAGISGHVGAVFPKQADSTVKYWETSIGHTIPLVDGAEWHLSLKDGGIGYVKDGQGIDLGAMSSVDRTDVEYWQERAAGRIGRAFMTDGKVWARVPEPCLGYWEHTGALELIDASAYESRLNRRVPMPKPYGLMNSSAHSYWDTRFHVFAFSDRDTLSELTGADIRSGKTGGYTSRVARDHLEDVVVSMPEVFGTAYAGLELERSARNAVTLARTELFESGRWLSSVPREFRESYETVREMTHPSLGVGVISEGLEDALEDLIFLWNDNPENPFLQGLAAHAGRHAADRWLASIYRYRERAISLDVELANLTSPGPR